MPPIRLLLIICVAGCWQRHLEPSTLPTPAAPATGISSEAAAAPPVATARAAAAHFRGTGLVAGSPRVAHVLIVSQDGLRPDAPAAAGARVFARLVSEGAFSPLARTTVQASTLPGHAAMLSGFDETRHGLTWNSWQPERGFIRVPTVFSVTAAAGKGTAAFVGKQKLAHIVRPDRVDRFSRPDYLCTKVAREAAAHFVASKPALQFVHFSDPDAEGHKSGWMSAEQLEAVRRADGCLGTLVDAIEQAGLEDDTLVLVSADHGGHGMGHRGHGNEADRRIPWLAWGAGVRRGHRLAGAITTMDTAATALWALGLPRPEGAAGTPVTEAFAPPPPTLWTRAPLFQ